MFVGRLLGKESKAVNGAGEDQIFGGGGFGFSSIHLASLVVNGDTSRRQDPDRSACWTLVKGNQSFAV